jgi:hypothetical protein
LTELQKLYPEEAKHLTLQNSLTGEAIKLKDQLINKMFQEARVKAAQDKLAELAKQELELNNDPSATDPSMMKKGFNWLFSQGNSVQNIGLNAYSKANNLVKGLEAIKLQRQTLEKFLKDSGNLEIATGGVTGTGGTDLTPTVSMTDTASSINSGARPTNINISLRNLVEKFEIHTSGSAGETTTEIKDKILTALLEVLNSANAVAFKGA